MRHVPLDQAPVDPKTSLFSRPWAMWFQQWSRLKVSLGSEVDGSLTRQQLEAQDARTLLGRGATEGHPEMIRLGAGLEMSGTTLSASAAISPSHYEPLTTGIVAAPELIYALGDVLMVEVFD